MTTSRQRVLEYVHSHRYVTATEIGRVLKMTPANARHHLVVLADQGVIEVVSDRPTGGKGRPAQVYAPARGIQGAGLEKLAVAALDLIEDSAPARETDHPLRLLALYLAKAGDERVETREISSAAEQGREKPIPQPHLTQRLYQAVSRLNELGYAARWEARSDAPRIILGYCPYASVLDDHPQLCHMDEFLIEALLQAPVKQAAKLAHDSRGAPFCMFLVSNRPKAG